jgi:hypothetical protein
VRSNWRRLHITDVPATRSLTYAKFVSGGVCGTCNSGWMNRLEQRVRPYLYPLMRGELEVSRLTNKQRQALSCWSLKTAAALCHAVDAVKNEVPYEHANYLYKTKAGNLPPSVCVVGTIAETSEYLWSICPTWVVEADRDTQVDAMAEVHPLAYKVFLQAGRLMLLCSYWPAPRESYMVESWLHKPLGGEPYCTTSLKDCRAFFPEESDQLIMGVGVKISRVSA